MDNKVNIKIKNSVVIVDDSDHIEKLVERFDIANASPNDCLHFLAKLKEDIKKH